MRTNTSSLGIGRSMAHVGAVTLACLVVLSGWASAQATAGGVTHTIRMRLLGATSDRLLTDGVRWAAYEPVAGKTRLMETVKGRSIVRADPEGCAGGLVAIGGAELLYACDDPECPGQAKSCRHVIRQATSPQEAPLESESRRYIVVDIASGTEHVVPGISAVPVELTYRTFALDEIGSQWAAGVEVRGGAATGHIAGSGLSVNWHTGQLIYERNKPRVAEASVDEEPSAAGEDFADLDSAQLLQPLCAPLERPLEPAEHFHYYGSLLYEPPFGVVGPAGALVSLAGPITRPVRFHLQRCESYAHVLLPEGVGVGERQLGGYVLSWGTGTEHGSIRYVTQLHPKGHAWHGPIYRITGIPEYGQEGNETLMQHTSTLALATVATNNFYVNETVENGTIYYARSPWAATQRKRTDDTGDRLARPQQAQICLSRRDKTAIRTRLGGHGRRSSRWHQHLACAPTGEPSGSIS